MELFSGNEISSDIALRGSTTDDISKISVWKIRSGIERGRERLYFEWDRIVAMISERIEVENRFDRRSLLNAFDIFHSVRVRSLEVFHWSLDSRSSMIEPLIFEDHCSSVLNVQQECRGDPCWWWKERSEREWIVVNGMIEDKDMWSTWTSSIYKMTNRFGFESWCVQWRETKEQKEKKKSDWRSFIRLSLSFSYALDISSIDEQISDD